MERLVEQQGRALEGLGRVLDREAERTDRRAVHQVEGMGEALLLAVDHQVDVALRPARHRLGAVLPRPPEAQPGQQGLESRRVLVVGREFDEAHALGMGARRQAEFAGAELVHHEAQRAMSVDRHAVRRAAAELVVEDLERQRVVVAGRQQRLHEVEHRQVALSGEIPEVTAPGEIVHLQQRRVGELDQEDAVARNRLDGGQIGAARQDVEAVEHQPDRRMVGAAHRLPGVAVVVDVAAPGQRLEGDAQAAFGGALAELAQVGGGALDAAQGVKRDVAADHQQVGAELLHDVELALGAGEGALALAGRHALEVAERLQGDDVEAELAAGVAHVGRRAVEGHEIVLEDLHGVELRRGDRLELLAQGAAQGNRRDRGLHASLLWCAPHPVVEELQGRQMRDLRRLRLVAEQHGRGAVCRVPVALVRPTEQVSDGQGAEFRGARRPERGSKARPRDCQRACAIDESRRRFATHQRDPETALKSIPARRHACFPRKRCLNL